jgi:hypothetical protein
MTYRKKPLHPPRLLLRIVTTAGAIGAAGCGDNNTVHPCQGFCFNLPTEQPDGSSEADTVVTSGIFPPNPGDAMVVVTTGVMVAIPDATVGAPGVMPVFPPDAGDE